MREQRKADRIQILGAEVDPVRVDRAITLTSRYLELNKFEYIVFVNTAAAIMGQEQEDFARFLSQAALVLPGDKNIENAIEGNLRIGEDETYQSEYFGRLFYKLNRMGASVYVMQEKEENLEIIHERFCHRYDRMQIEDTIWKEGENLDNLVNTINILAPDILLICGGFARIERFLHEYGSKINAGLCFCMEEIADGDGRNIPTWVRKLHLSGLYQWFYEKPRHAWNDSIFKRKMKENDQEQQEIQKESQKTGEEEKEE